MDLLGRLVKVTDPASRSVTNTYNHQGLLVASSNAVGQLGAYRYDLWDRVTNVVDANGVAVASSYDLLGRVLTRAYADGGVEAFGYTSNLTAPTSYTDTLSKVTRYAYDLAGRKTAATNALNEITRWTYGVGGELRTLTDGRNNVTSWGYDLFGRVTSKTNAANVEVLRFQYDAAGRLTDRWSKAKGNTAFGYDAVGNLTLVNLPASADITNRYDALDRLTNRVDAIGVTSWSYDSLGRLQSEDGPWDADRLAYGYTANDLLQTATLDQVGGAWSQTVGYDAGNRVTSLQTPAGSFGYGYFNTQGGRTNASGLARSVTLPGDLVVTNDYDAVGRLRSTTLRNGGAALLDSHSYAWNVRGQATNATRWDSSAMSYVYDALGQLVSATAKEAGGASRPHEQFGYGYDAAGNMTSRTNNALVVGFGVNNLNRLTQASRSGTLTVAGYVTAAATSVTVNGYDAGRYGDNTFAREGVSLVSGTNTLTAVAQDQLGRGSTNTVNANLPASASYAYDDNGNLVSDGSLGYGYDDQNQLVKVTATNAWESRFVYDGGGRRRERQEYVWDAGAWRLKESWRYVYAGQLVVQERDGNNLPVTTYTRGLDASGGWDGAGGAGGLLARTDGRSGESAYYQHDGLGNVSVLVDGAGAVVGRYLYDPYGRKLAAGGRLGSVNLCGYAGKELHEPSGLIYFGRRYYAPSLGRWLNADPIEEEGGINLYAYLTGNPVGGFDAWGMAEISIRVNWNDGSVTKEVGEYQRRKDGTVELSFRYGRQVYSRTLSPEEANKVFAAEAAARRAAQERYGAITRAGFGGGLVDPEDVREGVEKLQQIEGIVEGFVGAANPISTEVVIAGAGLKLVGTAVKVAPKVGALARVGGWIKGAAQTAAQKLASVWGKGAAKNPARIVGKGIPDPSGATIRMGRFDPRTGKTVFDEAGHLGQDVRGLTLVEKKGKVFWANDSLSSPKILTAQEVRAVESSLREAFPNAVIEQVQKIADTFGK